MQSESSVAQRVQKLRGLVSMRTVSKNDSIHHIDNLAPMIQIKFTLGHFMNPKIRAKEEELYNLVKEIEALRMANEGEEVPDYEFTNLHGDIKLSEMFGDKSGLFVIHNMGQGCRYCTIWKPNSQYFWFQKTALPLRGHSPTRGAGGSSWHRMMGKVTRLNRVLRRGRTTTQESHTSSSGMKRYSRRIMPLLDLVMPSVHCGTFSL